MIAAKKYDTFLKILAGNAHSIIKKGRHKINNTKLNKMPENEPSTSAAASTSQQSNKESLKRKNLPW